MIIRTRLLWECSLSFSCRVSDVLWPKDDACFFMIGSWLINLSVLDDLASIFSWVNIGCDVTKASLGTKNKLSLLHLGFQLCSVNSAGVRCKLLMSLARMRRVDRRLVWTTKSKIAWSQISTCVNWSICYDWSFLSWTAFVCTLETLCTLRPSRNTVVGYINITGCNWNFLYHFNWGWLACHLLLYVYIGA